MLAPHHSNFYRLDALPDAHTTVSKHWRQKSRQCKVVWNRWCCDVDVAVTLHCGVTVVQLPVTEFRSPTPVECGAKMTVQGTVAGRAYLHSKSSVSSALQVRAWDNLVGSVSLLLYLQMLLVDCQHLKNSCQSFCEIFDIGISYILGVMWSLHWWKTVSW